MLISVLAGTGNQQYKSQALFLGKLKTIDLQIKEKDLPYTGLPFSKLVKDTYINFGLLYYVDFPQKF